MDIDPKARRAVLTLLQAVNEMQSVLFYLVRKAATPEEVDELGKLSGKIAKRIDEVLRIFDEPDS